MKKLRLDDLKHFPAILAAPAMALGILFNDEYPLPFWFLTLVALAALILILLLSVAENRKMIPALTVTTAFFIGGATIVFSNSGFNPDPLGKLRQSDVNLTAGIVEIKEMNLERISFTGYVSSLSYDTTWKQISGDKKIKFSKTKTLRFAAPVKFIFDIRDPDISVFHRLQNELEPGRDITLSGSYFKPLNRRNPGGFDYAAYLQRQQIPASIQVYADSLIKIKGTRDPVSGTVYNLRRSIAGVIDSLHDAKTAAILKGLIIADRSSIDPETINNYIDTGIAHILAVSGFNVGVIYLLTLLLFQKLKPLSRGGEMAARLTILFFFLVITQFQITVVRAVLMFTVHSLLKFSGRESNGWNTLSITAILVLLFDPQDLFSASFQLSVAAVAGLFISESMKTEVLRSLYIKIAGMRSGSKTLLESITRSRLFRGGFELVMVTLFVQIFMLPFLISYFGKVTLLSIPANIAGVPLSSFMLINGILTIFISIFSSPFALFTAGVSSAANQLINFAVTTLKNTGWGNIEIADHTPFEAVLFYLLIALAVILISAKKNLLWRSFVVSATGILIVFSHLLLRTPILEDGKAYLIAIDVGQGDSYLLRNSKGETWMIDAGPVSKRFDSGERIVLPLLKRLGIDSISLAFVSHYDTDHAGGMLSLIRTGMIKKLAIPPPDSSDLTDLAFYNLFRRLASPVILRDSSRFTSGDLDMITYLNAPTPDMESNARSAVFMTILKGVKILFTGDLDKKGEKALIGKKLNLECDLLKVSHHGSNSGTSDQFLYKVKPRIAVISAGLGNRYRHPHPMVLERLGKGGTTILRTDLEGCIIIQFDSEKISQIDWR